MASVTYHIANLLEKMQSTDKDFRFMATNDLMSELQKDSIKLDDDSERKVVKMVLRLLEDKNGEVQNLAVKCLGPLVNKVKEYQVETIVESLCSNMLSDKEQLRDISSIGLKTVICELPQAPGGLSSNICKKITKRLTTAIEREDVSVQLEALEIVGDLLCRFGTVLSMFHGPILTALLPLLSSQRQAVRKRTISALSNLVLSCSNALYAKLLDHLYEKLQTKSPGLQNHTYIQCVAAVCRQSGHRFGEQISRFVPLIMNYIKEDDDELREYCLQAFEAFVLRCPNETTEHVIKIIDLCVMYVKYDPNYNYDEDEEESEDNGGGGRRNANPADDEDDEEENDEYSDDDDMSWKCRRAAAKCLECIILSRHEMLPDFYRNLSPELIKRFKEREENVKSDIFHAYIALLRQTRHSASSAVFSMDPDSMEQETPVYLLQQQVHQIVRAVQAQMREKSTKTRQDCFFLLKELCSVVPGALTQEIGALIPGIQYSLGDKNSNSTNMKIDALSFIHCLVMSHSPGVFYPYIPIILPAVVTAVGDSFYKITAEALTVLQELVRVIRPLPGTLDANGRLKSYLSMSSSFLTARNTLPVLQANLTPPMFDFVPYVPDIYRCTLARLRATDIDQEVKERAISAMGQIVCTLGDRLRDDLPDCMPLFLDRLRNEITRLTAVKAITKIACSPLNIPLSIINDAVPILGTFLRKNHRALKLSTLMLLDALIQNHHTHLSAELLQRVTVELPALLDEADLHIAQYTLNITRRVSERFPAAISTNTTALLPQAMLLVKSPLLQGTALTAMLELFAALAQSNIAGIRYDSLLQMLLSPVRSEEALHKQAYYSLAKCVAAITVNDYENALLVVDQFVREMPAPKTDSQHIFGLLVIGEIGRNIDLKSVKNLEQDIVESFSHISEEVKSAASYALGSIAIGNLNAYLTFILREIANQPKRQYLLLHSLKEVISCLSSDERLHPFLPEIWHQLFKHAESPEEGTRNVVAECLGKLTLIKPHVLLPGLQENLNSPSPLMRTTCVTAVKFTISDQPSPIDPLLRQCIGEFLNTLTDKDLNVRRVALVAFNSAAHNKPSLIRDLLDGILPQLYSETVVKRDLIREVEMGPFTHTVDDGLDIRKAAFECMYTLLDSCVDRIDIFEFLNHVESGLKDHYDIKMLTYLMVARLAQICPGAVLQRLDKLVEPLRTTCTTKVKANSVKQEYEKQDELKRSAMRAVIALLTIPDADKNPQLSEFLNYIRNSTDLQPVFESIQRDTTVVATHHDSFLMDQS